MNLMIYVHYLQTWHIVSTILPSFHVYNQRRENKYLGLEGKESRRLHHTI